MTYYVVLHLLGLVRSTMADFTDRDTHEAYDEMMISAYAVYRQCDRKGEDEVKKLIVDITQMHDDHKHSNFCVFDHRL